MDRPSTVYIIDPNDTDRNIVRETAVGMQAACESFGSAEAFLESYADESSGRESVHGPGCVVAEFRLLGMNGLELQEQLARWGCQLPLLFVTGSAETRLTVAAMRAGAVTVLDKPVGRQQLWDAVYSALSLGRELYVQAARQGDLCRRLNTLTLKERQVLDLMLQGLPNKSIARRLDISIRTVETRRSQIFKKTSTQSVAALVRLTLQATPKGLPEPGLRSEYRPAAGIPATLPIAAGPSVPTMVPTTSTAKLAPARLPGNEVELRAAAGRPIIPTSVSAGDPRSAKSQPDMATPRGPSSTRTCSGL